MIYVKAINAYTPDDLATEMNKFFKEHQPEIACSGLIEGLSMFEVINVSTFNFMMPVKLQNQVAPVFTAVITYRVSEMMAGEEQTALPLQEGV